MNSYLEFLLKSSLNLIILYGFYVLLLRKETYFQVNRLFLLFVSFIALIIPFITIPSKSIPIGNALYSSMLETFEVGSESMLQTTGKQISVSKILSIIYYTGTLIFFLRFLTSIFQIYSFIRNNPVIDQGDYKLVNTGKDIAPFSFFNYIFVGKDFSSTIENSQILEHELIHVRSKHTYDILLCELVIILQWFNPFAWYLKQSTQMTHEYIADKGVLLKGFDKADYSYLMLHHYFGLRMNQLANNFQNSIINSRIIMMTKNKSKSKVWKYFLIIPILSSLVLLQNCNEKESATTQAKADSEITLDGEPVFNTVDEMPVYDVANEAGYLGVRKFMAQNLRYPEQATEKGVQAKVFVQFVVDKNGIVKDVTPIRVDAEKVSGDEVVVVAYGVASKDGVDYSDEIKLLEDEAVRVIRSIGKWNKPGYVNGEAVNVAFTFPVKFVLQ